MNNFKKHTDVVPSIDVFNTNYKNNIYVEPWVVYVGNDVDGYQIIYSNDEKKIGSTYTPDVIDSLQTRLNALENEKVYCYEEEYENLVKNGKGWITNIDGEKIEVTFDENKLYFIYEDEGEVEVEDDEETEIE